MFSPRLPDRHLAWVTHPPKSAVYWIVLPSTGAEPSLRTTLELLRRTLGEDADRARRGPHRSELSSRTPLPR